MRKKPLVLVVLLLISLLLSACSSNDGVLTVKSEEEKLIDLGRELTEKVIVNYFDSRSKEELEEKFIPLFDEKFIKRTGMRATLFVSHEHDIRDIISSEVVEVSDESIKRTEGDSFTYNAIIRTQYNYVEPPSDDKPYETSRKEWNVKIVKNANGEYKVLDYEYHIPGLGP